MMKQIYNTDVDKAVQETIGPLKVIVDFITGVGMYVVGIIVVLSLIAFIYAQKSEKSELRDKAKTALVASIVILGILIALPTLLNLLGVV